MLNIKIPVLFLETFEHFHDRYFCSPCLQVVVKVNKPIFRQHHLQRPLCITMPCLVNNLTYWFKKWNHKSLDSQFIRANWFSNQRIAFEISLIPISSNSWRLLMKIGKIDRYLRYSNNQGKEKFTRKAKCKSCYINFKSLQGSFPLQANGFKIHDEQA